MARRGIKLLAAALVCAGALRGQAAADGAAIFDLRSGFWLNLHQFLFQQAAASTPPASGSPDWRRAVEYYRKEVVPGGLMSEQAAAVNNRLSAAGSSAELPPAGLDPGLVAALSQAAPEYRHSAWPEHNRSNLAWIEAVKPLLAKYGAAIRKDLAAVYQVDWPADPILTDVSAYASPVGGYTTSNPSHTTISSTDPSYQGAAALEMLFHEASHIIDGNVRAALTAELHARQQLFRRRAFDHAILFYNAGEITRRYLAGYEPYGIKNGVLENGWPGSLAVLEKDWKPYLESRIDLAAAVRAVVADYGVPKADQ